MKVYETLNIRNIALAGHIGSGKTSLSEALIWTLKQSPQLGKTDDGTALSDYDPEEQRRHCSIQASLIPVEHAGCKINILDLPGYRDFAGEIKGCLRASDSMFLVFDAGGNVETGAETVWSYAEEYALPRAVFVNKLDKEHTSFSAAVQKLHDAFDVRMVPLTIPIGEELGFKGVIDLLKMKRVVEDGQKVTYEDIPAEMAEEAKRARAKLTEAAAEGDDELTMKFLEQESLSDEEIMHGMLENIEERRMVPVLCGSATALKGIRPLLDFFVQCTPDPTFHSGYDYVEKEGGEVKALKVSPEGPEALYVFKTVNDPYAGRLSFYKVLRGRARSEGTLLNVNKNKNERVGHLLFCRGKKSENIDSMNAGDIGAIAKLDQTTTGDTLIEAGSPPMTITPLALTKPVVFMAVHAKSRADEDKIGVGFHRLIEQDPTLHVRRDPSIKQTILSGMGETHLSVAAARLKDISHVEVDLEIPHVPYRETITRKGEGQGKYKKQTGGHGQYGDCHIRFEPLPEGTGFEFVWEVVGGAIPTNFKPAVEKGLLESIEHGVLSGSPTVDIRAACFFGSYHDVDSSEMSFKIAASMAFKAVIPKCGPIILEPIYKVKIMVPEEYMGDVMGDLNGRRGRILGMNQNGRKQVIEAIVPLSELFTYSRQLNSLSQGRGLFDMDYDHYERVPNEVQEKIVAEAAKHRTEEAG